MQKKENNVVHFTSSTIEAQVNKAVKEVVSHYAKDTKVYLDSVRHYVLHISKLKSKIQTLEDELKPEEKILKSLENDIIYGQRVLSLLNENFEKHVSLFKALDEEYSDIVEKKIQEKILSKKKEEVIKLLDDIEELETNLLNDELQKINLFITLEPKQSQIKQLLVQLKEIELEKEHFETTKLPSMDYLPNMSQNISNEKKEDIVDIDVVEEDISEER